MIKIEENLLNLRHLDELANQTSCIHRLHPCMKLLTTFIFIIIVTSFPKYEITAFFPLFLYPAVVIPLGGIPIKLLLKRLLPVLPFIMFIGIFNPIFDNAPFFQLGTHQISYGWISFFSILLRSLLAITAALMLIATTGMNAICSALIRLKVPRVFVIQLSFMYRYLYILLDEVVRTSRAYTLRSFHSAGFSYKILGSLLGQLLLRTFDRAQRIYNAMLCRGFNGNIPLAASNTLHWPDFLYLIVWSAFFMLARYHNIPHWLGLLITEGCK